MNKTLWIVNISLFFLLNACTPTSLTTESPLKQLTNEKTTILFSDSSTLQNESSYYDALLELQTTHSDTTPFILIIDATEHNIIRYYDIKEFPTILVLTGEKESLRMEGTFSKDIILTQLIEVYRTEKVS